LSCATWSARKVHLAADQRDEHGQGRERAGRSIDPRAHARLRHRDHPWRPAKASRRYGRSQPRLSCETASPAPDWAEFMPLAGEHSNIQSTCFCGLNPRLGVVLISANVGITTAVPVDTGPRSCIYRGRRCHCQSQTPSCSPSCKWGRKSNSRGNELAGIPDASQPIFKRRTASRVAVGTLIAERPPHRSRRALLTHRAPPSGRTSAARGLKPPSVTLDSPLLVSSGRDSDSTLGAAVESITRMTRAVLYARVSSDLQRKEGTIESQVAELKRQIAEAGHVTAPQPIIPPVIKLPASSPFVGS
jgi:hypothetical protein